MRLVSWVARSARRPEAETGGSSCGRRDAVVVVVDDVS